jgi:hypothetical protein
LRVDGGSSSRLTAQFASVLRGHLRLFHLKAQFVASRT